MMKRHLVDVLVTILREGKKGSCVYLPLVHNNLRMSQGQGFYLMLHYKLLKGTLM